MSNEKLTIDGSGWVWLSLPSKDYKPERKIGQIKKGVLYLQRYNNHYFRASQGIAINYELLKNGSYNTITLNLDCKIYQTTRRYFLDHSNYINYKSHQLDRQKTMPLDLWNIQEALKYEADLGRSVEVKRELQNAEKMHTKHELKFEQLCLV
jgi:hypothetical protein